MSRKWAFTIIVAAAFMISSAVVVHCQEQEPWYTFNIGAGYSPLVGQVSNRLDNGWHVGVGAGFRTTSHFELNGEFTYNGFGVKPSVLAEAGVPSADSHLWSVTADPKLRFRGGHHFDPYLVGAVGYYRAQSISQLRLWLL